jgi:hypothetical protein
LILASGESSVKLRGLFQNEDCYSPVADEIRQVFAMPPSEIERENGTQVCVHVRRGGVYSPKHGVCSLDIYVVAMRLMAEMISDARFLVLSDDPKWCSENIVGGADLSILVACNEREAFTRMMCCDAFILSNSTLGWWGAWLSQPQW